MSPSTEARMLIAEAEQAMRERGLNPYRIEDWTTFDNILEDGKDGKSELRTIPR